MVHPFFMTEHLLYLFFLKIFFTEPPAKACLPNVAVLLKDLRFDRYFNNKAASDPIAIKIITP